MVAVTGVTVSETRDKNRRPVCAGDHERVAVDAGTHGAHA
jgi:hypothetical protein